MAPVHYKIGVVLFDEALPLDFIGPTTIFHALSPAILERGGIASSHSFSVSYLAASLDTLHLTGGLQVVPNQTFEQVKNENDLDVILMPGGFGARPGPINEAAREFLGWAVPNVKYVLTVCTGSGLLAHTGLLAGQNATTNKNDFKNTIARTGHSGVTWIPKARWVVSDKFWTASGVSAGMDMACAFIEHVAGKEVNYHAQKFAEYTASGQDDDPWSAVCGLSE